MPIHIMEYGYNEISRILLIINIHNITFVKYKIKNNF